MYKFVRFFTIFHVFSAQNLGNSLPGSKFFMYHYLNHPQRKTKLRRDMFPGFCGCPDQDVTA